MLATYEIVCSKYPDPQVGTAVKAFLQSTIGAGQNGLADNGYIPDSGRVQVEAVDRGQRHRVIRGCHGPNPEIRPPGLPSAAPPVGGPIPAMPNRRSRRRHRSPLAPVPGAGGTEFQSLAPPRVRRSSSRSLLIAIFLLIRAIPSLRANHANFFTSAQFDTTMPTTWRSVSVTCSW